MPTQFTNYISNSGASQSGSAPPTTMQVPSIPDVSWLDAEIAGITNMGQDKIRDMNLAEINQPAIMTINSIDSGEIKFMTNKFFLQSVTKPKLERFQIIETFRESKLFFFGERTKVYTIQGMLLEALDQNYASLDSTELLNSDQAEMDVTNQLQLRDQYRWSTALQTFYDEHLRGTRLAENRHIAGLFFERSSIIGYPLQLQIQRDANNPMLTQFQMTWAVYKEEFFDHYTKVLYTPTEPISTEDKAEMARLKSEKASTKKAYEEANIAYIEEEAKFRAGGLYGEAELKRILDPKKAKVAELEQAMHNADEAYRRFYRRTLYDKNSKEGIG